MAPGDPEAQPITKAITAFATNSRRCIHTLGLPPLPSKVVAGITTTGTSPTFYNTNVSTELVTAVGGGPCLKTPTVVFAHLPAVPRFQRRLSEGRKPLDNSQIILPCYEAFKKFVN